MSAAERILGDRDRAEDIAQEVFVRLWRDPSRYDASRGALGPYLKLSARSRALDAWRSDQAAGRAVERLESLAERPGSGGVDAPDRLAERASERSMLFKKLRLLPEAQREAVLLAFWGELPSSEIAKRTAVPLGTAKSRVRLGVAKLGELFPPAESRAA